METIKILLLLYVISFGLIYALQRKVGTPFLLPGDLYVGKGSLKAYVPFGSSLILTLVIFLLIKAFTDF